MKTTTTGPDLFMRTPPAPAIVSSSPFVEPKRVAPAVETNPAKRNLREAAAAWIGTHPDACALLLKFARELAAKGKRFGVKLLVERLRSEGPVEDRGRDEYKVNNAYTAYLARWLIGQDPSLEKHMRFRETVW